MINSFSKLIASVIEFFNSVIVGLAANRNYYNKFAKINVVLVSSVL